MYCLKLTLIDLNTKDDVTKFYLSSDNQDAIVETKKSLDLMGLVEGEFKATWDLPPSHCHYILIGERLIVCGKKNTLWERQQV
jgi:hypothetical protein